MEVPVVRFIFKYEEEVLKEVEYLLDALYRLSHTELDLNSLIKDNKDHFHAFSDAINDIYANATIEENPKSWEGEDDYDM